MSRRLLRQWAALIAAVPALCANPIGAQQYPAKPIRFIVASSAGSGTDVIARLVGNGMTAVMHQQIVLDYRPGAGGNVAAEIVAKSPPDGYTLLVAMVSHAANASLYRKLQYDLTRDLAAVTQFATSPQVVVVHPSLPVRSVTFRRLGLAAAARLTDTVGGVAELPILYSSVVERR